MRWFVRILVAVCLATAPAVAWSDSDDRAEVMLFGVFHFANPGLDAVKTETINVMTPENQAYLDELAQRIATFNPTRVLLEYPPARDGEMQARYQQYLDGDFELGSNENYQLGFRIAALSEAETVHGYDERNVHWNAQPLFDYMENHDQESAAKVQAMIEDITAKMTEAHQTLTLQQVLRQHNDPEFDRENRASYLLTNAVGDATNYAGADAAASWWHRNFRMFANIQRQALPRERLLVIGGQGHTAILKQLLADDASLVSVDVRDFL